MVKVSDQRFKQVDRYALDSFGTDASLIDRLGKAWISNIYLLICGLILKNKVFFFWISFFIVVIAKIIAHVIKLERLKLIWEKVELS